MNSNLSYSSKADDKFKFCCWILNDRSGGFSIDIRKSEIVHELKKAIKKENERTLAGIDPKTLKLWKLSLPISSSEIEKLKRAQTLEDIGNCIELKSIDELSDHFLSPPPRRHVHIIVQLPLYRSTEDTEECQFRLLCEKYWNRGEEGRAEIYKTRTVQVPFMARPRTERAKGAATTSEGMVIDAEYLETCAQEVIPVASKTTSAPSDDTSDGSNEGLYEELDPDFDSGINCTVPYESLSLASDFSDFFGKDYTSILVRKEYRDMFQHISDLHRDGKRGVVVTGMPGIGKSIFLFFVLIERILNGQPTAYQCSPNRVILILGHDDLRIFPVDVYLDPRGFPGTWALVDSNAGLIQPHDAFMSNHSKFYLVQAAAPEPARWNGWKKQLSAKLAVMKPWSWEELYIGGTEFISPPLETLTLRNICVKYGGSARHCYTLSKSRGEVTQWEKQIPYLLAGIPDIAIFEGYMAGNSVHLSSELITIVPDSTRQPCVTLVSRHIAEHFFRAVFVHNHKRFWTYFNQFLRKAESHTPARWLWELYVREALSMQRTPISLCHLSPVKSSQPPTKKIRITPNPIELPFSEVVQCDREVLCEELSRAISSLSLKKSTLFIPGTRNQFNAFSISGDNLVTFYQATIRESHSIQAKGLDFVWDALKLAEGQRTSDAKGLIPSSARKWRIVFLIPKEVEKHWKTAQDIDFEDTEPKRQWDQYVEQLVGVLQERTMADLDG